MTIYVFTGPTISGEDASHHLDAVYLPPVSQGDIVSLLPHNPTVIGIIDGYFDRVPAVWHKEILLAISEGVLVVGGASMGALRAAELHSFGMIGVGEIFEWYRDGLIEADDEVAVQHATAEFGFRPFNEALVNIRKTLQVAREAAIITPETEAALLEIGRLTLYPSRSFARLLADGQAQGLSEKEIKRLELFIAQGAIDLKRQDAVTLLTYIAQLPPEPARTAPSFTLNETVFLARLLDRDRLINGLGAANGQADRTAAITNSDLVNYLRFDTDGFLALKERASMNSIALALAEHLGLAATEQDVEKETAEFQQRIGLADETAVAEWRQRNYLSEAEFHRLMEELALIDKVTEIYQKLTASNTIIRQLLIEDSYEDTFLAAQKKAAVLNESYTPPDHSLVDLIQFYFEAKGEAVPDDMTAYAANLGFSDYRAFVLELEKSYHFQQQRKAETGQGVD